MFRSAYRLMLLLPTQVGIGTSRVDELSAPDAADEQKPSRINPN